MTRDKEKKGSAECRNHDAAQEHDGVSQPVKCVECRLNVPQIHDREANQNR